MRVSTNEVHKPNRNIMPVIGNGLPIQQIEHTLQIGKLISPPAPVQAVAPSVMLHQIVNDNLLTEITGIIGFVVPAQSLKYIDNPTFENVLLIVVKLFKGTQNVGFANRREIALFQVLCPLTEPPRVSWRVFYL